MASRFFLMQMVEVVDPISGETTLQPEYGAQILAAGGGWSLTDLGNLCIIHVDDVSQGDLDTLAGLSDVVGLPQNLDDAIGSGGVTQAQTVLGQLNLPSGWVQDTMDARTVVRGMVAMILIRQRARDADLLGDGRTLSSTVGDIPTSQRQAFVSSVQSLGIDTEGITLAWTIGQALRTLAARYDRPIRLGSAVI